MDWNFHRMALNLRLMRVKTTGSGSTRQAILDAALRLFAAKGYAGTSVRDITQASSRTQPVLYYHFKNKARLYEALVQEAYKECQERMREAAMRHSEIAEQLTAALEAILTFVREKRDLTWLAFSTAFAAPEELPAAIRKVSQSHSNLEFIRLLIKRAQKMGALNSHFNSLELARAIYGALTYQVMANLVWDEKLRGRQQAERMVQVFLEGARPSHSLRQARP